MILLSNVIIHYLKGNEAVVSRIQSATPGELFIPSVVAYELAYGSLKLRNSRARTMLARILRGLVDVPFDSVAAVESARIRVELENAGIVMVPMDLLIAGTALSRNALLITNNTGEFRRVAGLRVEDWSK